MKKYLSFVKWVIFGGNPRLHNLRPSEKFFQKIGPIVSPESKKAYQLLWKYLTKSQINDLESTLEFFVIGFSGAPYKINYYGKISLGKEIYTEAKVSFCVTPLKSMPYGDKLLHLVIALQTEEGEKYFLDRAVANTTGTFLGVSGRIIDPVALMFAPSPRMGRVQGEAYLL